MNPVVSHFETIVVCVLMVISLQFPYGALIVDGVLVYMGVFGFGHSRWFIIRAIEHGMFGGGGHGKAQPAVKTESSGESVELNRLLSSTDSEMSPSAQEEMLRGEVERVLSAPNAVAV